MITADAKPKKGKRDKKKERLAARERFRKAQLAERKFSSQLRAIAKHVDTIVRGFAPKGVVQNTAELSAALNKYADLLEPWARSVATRMQAEVDKRDEHAWAVQGRAMGVALRNEIKKAPTGTMLRDYLAEQVDLITSLPREAAQRVHKLTLNAIVEGGARASEIAQEILNTGKVTEGRAMLIARTEVARTASALTQKRSEFVGSEGYIWRTSGDSDVRKSHRQMEGKYVRWDKPPTLSDGTTTHAGQIYNCRCWPEPVLPDQL